jgi:hypothetical protein
MFSKARKIVLAICLIFSNSCGHSGAYKIAETHGRFSGARVRNRTRGHVGRIILLILHLPEISFINIIPAVVESSAAVFVS